MIISWSHQRCSRACSVVSITTWQRMPWMLWPKSESTTLRNPCCWIQWPSVLCYRVVSRSRSNSKFPLKAQRGIANKSAFRMLNQVWLGLSILCWSAIILEKPRCDNRRPRELWTVETLTMWLLRTAQESSSQPQAQYYFVLYLDCQLQILELKGKHWL